MLINTFISQFLNKKLLPLSLLIFLSACSSMSPPTHYYLLSEDLGPIINIENDERPLYLKSVTLADHLNQAALVMMVENQQAQVSNYHFWAERLDNAVSRVLTHDLEEACLCRVLNEQRADDQPENAISLSLHVEQMAATVKGQVLFSGRYRITTKEKQSVHRFRYQQAMEGTGFQFAIATKRMLISALAKDINKTLSD